jgi:acyl-CoA carboxylase subunit beta
MAEDLPSRQRHDPAETELGIGVWGEHGGALDVLREQMLPKPSDLDLLLEARPYIHPEVIVDGVLGNVGFVKQHEHWQVVHDIVGMVRMRRQGEDRDETYLDKLEREQNKNKGKHRESASYGLANILGHKAVLFVMNWGHFAGSLGEVAGEKFVKAAELATKKNLPFVGIYASSGVRQQENTLGLVQMQRGAAAIENYKKRTRYPHVAILAGQVWGGVSASAVPKADLLVALSGTDFGFSGPKVIETFQRFPVKKGSQSAEAAYLDRNVDAIAHHPEELLHFLGRLYHIAPRDRHFKWDPEKVPEIEALPGEGDKVLTLGSNGYAPLLPSNQEPKTAVHLKPRPVVGRTEGEQLMAKYEALVSDPGRPDTEFILQHVFTDVVPFYNHYVAGNRKVYPAIISALGRIGEQTFLVIGNQPSYEDRSGYVRKLPANAKPEDFEYQVRMMEMGKRLGLPVIFFTDTLGAEPTLRAEKRGQSRAIAEAISMNATYPHPIITVITGALGSGGGLGTGPFKESVLMLENAMAFVSEPSSTASIIYKKAGPSAQEVMTTLSTMRATSGFHQEIGLVDAIISESPVPRTTAMNIRHALIKAYTDINNLSSKQKQKIVDKRLTPRGINNHQ